MSRGGTTGTAGAKAGQREGDLIPRVVVGLVAIIGAVALALVALLGPLGTGAIEYRTSQS